MKYKIKASLIQASWFEEAIFKTLDMYEAGKDITDSPLNVFQRNYLTWGGRHRSLIGKENDFEKGLKDRTIDFIELYKRIKDNGYDEDSPALLVWFDNDGFIRLYDGHHRISILKYLGLDPDIWVETEWQSIDVENTVGCDFPLVKKLVEKHGARRLYHYVDDPRVKDFWINRPDGPSRLKYFSKKLVGKSVLDIGCSEGYFSCEFAKMGYKTTGIDIDKKLIAIARYLALINNTKVKFRTMEWEDLLRENDVFFDNIFYLSVLHNEVNHFGEAQAFKNLKIFRGRTKRLFIEVPDISVQKDWSHIFTLPQLLPRLERETGMKVEEIWQGPDGEAYRPIIILTNQYNRMKKVKSSTKKIPMKIFNKKKVNGLEMNLIASDHPITTSIMETGKWEEKTTKFIKDNLKKGQIFVDIGASVGYYTLLASKLVGNEGKVYSFEPLDDNFAVLTKNLAINSIKNVIVFFTALSNKPEAKIKLFGADIPGQYSIIDTENHDFKEVNNNIFDKLNKKEAIVPDMIKIDVEGAQIEVLEGMREVLGDRKEMTIIIEDYTQEAVEWLMENFGFEVVTTEREAGNYMLVKPQGNLKSVNSIKAKEEPITFHLLGTFNTPTNLKEGIGYAFCSKIMNVSKALMSKGHKVIFYGAEGSEVVCNEFVRVLDKKDLPVEVWNNKYVEDKNHSANKIFNKNCIKEIIKRKSKYFHSRDILLIPTGSYQKPVADAVGLKLIAEIGIGYKGVFTDHKIFESYAWQHWHYGNLHQSEGKFYDAVIPPIFDPKDFDYREKKDDYFLYLGRITHNKGITIAKETCEAIGAKLKVAGIDQGMKIEGPNIEMVGFADLEKRKELISHAKAVFVPTIYIEPFGYIIMEAAMSGTPVITTDWGSFPEIVEHGKTGFRCRSLAQFIMAAENVDRIKPQDCQDWAMNFTLEKIAPLYDQYFKQMQNLFGRGWYSRLN